MAKALYRKPPQGGFTPQDEQAFQAWYAKVARHKGLSPNADDPKAYYDYRGFWKGEPSAREAILTEAADAHFTDRYKRPGHPTFSDESMYSGKEAQGGKWTQDASGKWVFSHSDYTLNYSDRTNAYLKGTGERAEYQGGTVLPTVQVTAKKAARKYAGGGAVQLNGQTGEVEAEVKGGERIFSRADTKKIVALAQTGDDAALGRHVYEALKKQDGRPQEYTDS